MNVDYIDRAEAMVRRLGWLKAFKVACTMYRRYPRPYWGRVMIHVRDMGML